MKTLILAASHALILCAGVISGIYLLPILVEPKGLSPGEVNTQASAAAFTGRFLRDLRGSDLLHWGEGKVYVGAHDITLDGQLAPGPDYKLYLSPVFVETAADFERNKSRMVKIADIRAFHNFHVSVPNEIDPNRFSTAVIWCETFHKFISAARYR